MFLDCEMTMYKIKNNWYTEPTGFKGILWGQAKEGAEVYVMDAFQGEAVALGPCTVISISNRVLRSNVGYFNFKPEHLMIKDGNNERVI